MGKEMMGRSRVCVCVCLGGGGGGGVTSVLRLTLGAGNERRSQW